MAKHDDVAIPDELRAALSGEPALKQAFARFSPSHRREYAQWVGSAKRAETRAARAAKAVTMIASRTRPGGA